MNPLLRPFALLSLATLGWLGMPADAHASKIGIFGDHCYGDAAATYISAAGSTPVALTTLDGRILGHHDEPARIEAGPEACLERVDVLFASLLATTRSVPGRLWGVGIAVPGPVEFQTGRPISPP